MTYKEHCPTCYQNKTEVNGTHKPDYNTSDEVALWVNAMRYCVGRNTYAVDEFIEMCKRHWSNLQDRTRGVLMKDLLRAINHDTPETRLNDWLDLQEFMSANLSANTEAETID